MRWLFPQIATLTLLVHTTAGCCPHHAHAEAGGRECPHWAAGWACDDHAEEPGASQQHGDSRDHLCDGSICVFIRSSDSAEQFESIVGLPDLETGVSPTGAVKLRSPSVGCPVPAVRPHLLHQVLLI